MTRRSKIESDDEYVTTGEAARICAVTRNTVLRWVHDGTLSADSTAGGHHRIRRTELAKVRGGSKRTRQPRSTRPAVRYCWEFHSESGTVAAECLNCIAYRSRSGRCYQLAELPLEAEHPHLHCTDTCEDCEYFRELKDKRPSVMIVSPQSDLRDQISHSPDSEIDHLQFVDDEYKCCLELDKFQPDYVVIDCSLGTERSLALARSLSEDRRIPFVRVILVGKPEQLPTSCEEAAFAFVRSSLDVDVLTELIANL